MSSNVAGPLPAPLPAPLLGLTGAEAAEAAEGAGLGLPSGRCICAGGAVPTLPGIGPGEFVLGRPMDGGPERGAPEPAGILSARTPAAPGTRENRSWFTCGGISDTGRAEAIRGSIPAGGMPGLPTACLGGRPA
jgi:hypothetical protein